MMQAVRILAASVAALATVAHAQPLVVSHSEIARERIRLSNAAFDAWLVGQLRVTRVDSRLRSDNAAECEPETVPVTGLIARSAADLPQAFRDVAYQRFGADDLLTVLAVAPGLPADSAGLRPGDAILRANGQELRSLGAIASPNPGESSLTLQIARDGRVFDVSIPILSGCPRPAEFAPFDSIDLYADGARVAVCAGLLRFLESDDELAILLGHELAHTILGEDADEISADRFGLEIAARAGYRVGNAASLSQRLERESPIGLADRESYAHPVSNLRWQRLAERAASMDPPIPAAESPR
jgi:membrane-associated protease RseP (regulator of RpoE activity)